MLLSAGMSHGPSLLQLQFLPWSWSKSVTRSEWKTSSRDPTYAIHDRSLDIDRNVGCRLNHGHSFHHSHFIGDGRSLGSRRDVGHLVRDDVRHRLQHSLGLEKERSTQRHTQDNMKTHVVNDLSADVYASVRGRLNDGGELGFGNEVRHCGSVGHGSSVGHCSCRAPQSLYCQ